MKAGGKRLKRGRSQLFQPVHVGDECSARDSWIWEHNHALFVFTSSCPAWEDRARWFGLSADTPCQCTGICLSCRDRFTWSDGSSAGGYLNWRDNQPSNNDECMAMDQSGKWWGFECSLQLKFICEKGKSTAKSVTVVVKNISYMACIMGLFL